MKREEVDVIQLALPVYGANDTQVLNNLRQAVASLKKPGPDAPKCHPDGARGVDDGCISQSAYNSRSDSKP